MKKLLWLDDIRNPFLDLEGKVPSNENYIVHWVLNYDQFVQYVTKFGLPDVISFDHDLGLDHYINLVEQGYSKRSARKESKEKTGYDCAKWLIDYCLDNKLNLPGFYIHSMNPVGKQNIAGLFQSFLNRR